MLAVAFALSALAGCAGDDEDTPTAEPGGQARTQQEGSAPDEQGSPATPAQGRPVRLLLLGRFDQPTYIAAPPGDRRRRFVVQREGSIVVVRGRRRSTFLDIEDLVSTGGESGLLSMAFARDYRSSGRFFVYYTDNQGFIQIDQFRRSSDPNRADPASRRSVMRVPHSRFNHKGGQLQVGPDGMLYAGFGDGGGGGDPDENAQNLGRILGKLIRIDPRPNGGYDIPSSNPFRGRSAGRRLQLRLGRLRGPQQLRGRQGAGTPGPGDPSRPGGRLLLDHRRLRHPRPVAARHPLLRPLRVRRPLRAVAPTRLPQAAERADPAERPARLAARLVRRGRPRAGLRGVARRARVPHRPPLTRAFPSASAESLPPGWRRRFSPMHAVTGCACSGAWCLRSERSSCSHARGTTGRPF